MSDQPPFSPPPERLTTGIGGLDELLTGGLFRGGIYMVVGAPGSGKTILANQMAFHLARAGRKTLYVTLLAETHGRMLSQLQVLSFFDPAMVGAKVKYLNGFSTIEADGLGGLLALLRGAVREHGAELLVLDGVVTVGALAKTAVDFKKFISDLQTFVAMAGCTAIFLTSSGGSEPNGIGGEPEHTMVDGIVELRAIRKGMGLARQLSISKFRGSGFTEGAHNYAVRKEGMIVWPRIEAHLQPHPVSKADPTRVVFGIKPLDKMLGGGLARRSTTLLLGSSGVGKTVLGAHFLSEGARRKEHCVHFGFFESPADLCSKADRVGLAFTEYCGSGLIDILWQKPAEQVLDELGYALLRVVDEKQSRRVFIDGLVGFRETVYPERMASFFSVLTEQLAARGVTTVISEETRELFVREVEIPTSGVSAIFHNILFLRQTELDHEIGRAITVMKTRDSEHDRAVHSFHISEKGFQVGAAVKSARGALTGDSPGDGDGRRGRRR